MYFEQANASLFPHCEERPIGFLMTSRNVSIYDEDHPITAPVDVEAASSKPFLYETPDGICTWADQHLALPQGTFLMSDLMVVLDERIATDGMCLLIAEAETLDSKDRFLFVRSDFASSLVALGVSATAVGGDEHLDPGPGGVLRHNAEK